MTELVYAFQRLNNHLDSESVGDSNPNCHCHHGLAHIGEEIHRYLSFGRCTVHFFSVSQDLSEIILVRNISLIY